MSTALRPWLHSYITALPKPDTPLPTAASLQITDYSTEPSTSSPTAPPRVTAIVSDGHLRIRAPVDEQALKAVRDSTPLPQWRGAIIALDNWTLSYTLDEFVVQLHAFHVLQAVGSSDIGSARHCMDDQQVRQTYAIIRQANTQQRHKHIHTHHSTLFPNQPLPPPSYSLTQPIPAELVSVRPPSGELSYLYSVPEVCQRELDRLPPREGGDMQHPVGGVADAADASGVGLSQWSSDSDEKEEKSEYFSQYSAIRPPIIQSTATTTAPLFPPLQPPSTVAQLSSSSSSASPSSVLPLSPNPAMQRQPAQPAQPDADNYSPFYLTPSPPQPQPSQPPASPLSVSSDLSSHPGDDAETVGPASQHNLMETSLERDALLVDDTHDIHTTAAVASSSSSSQPQLAQPRDDEHSLLPSQHSQVSHSSDASGAAADEPFVDDGFFMTQAPSMSEYASQPAASQAADDHSLGSEHDLVFDLDEMDVVAAADTEEGADAVGASTAAEATRLRDDPFPSSMPPLSPGPPSPNTSVEDEAVREERKEQRVDNLPVAVAERIVIDVEVEREDGGGAVDAVAGHFSGEMISRRQRERNAELMRQRQETEEKAPTHLQQHQHQQESKEVEQQHEVEVDGNRAPERMLAKRVRSTAEVGNGDGTADKRRRSVRFDEERNSEHEARDDTSDGSSVVESGSGESLADLLRGVSVDEVAHQPMASFDGWSDEDSAWHCQYWKAVQL